MTKMPAFPQQPQQQRQNHADDEARHDWKMEAEIALGIMDVAGQPAQPALAEARPKQCAHGGDEQAGYDEKFAKFVHRTFASRNCTIA